MFPMASDRRSVGTSSSRSSRLAALLIAVLAAAACDDGSSRRRPRIRPGEVFINEIVANASLDEPDSPAILRDENGDPILDANGDPVDWIEFFNASPKPARIGAAWVSDDPARPRLFRFLPRKLRIQPGEFLVLICDGRPELGPLHAPFTLETAGETIRMSTRKGRLGLDEREYVDLEANVAAGRFPDGEFDYGLIYVATPGAPNKPIGVKLPRLDGNAVLGPPAADSTRIAVPVREDRELLAASVEVLPVDDCDAAVAPDAQFLGPFTLDTVVEQTEVTETRRTVLGEPIDVPVQRLIIQGSLPRFDAGTRLRLRFRLVNVMGVARDVQCQAVSGGGGAPLLDFDNAAFVEPRCPSPAESASVFAFLHVAEESAAQDPLPIDASLTFLAGGAPEQTVDLASGLEIRPAEACELECYRVPAVADSRAFRVAFDIPAQPAGTLVTFSFEARDTSRGETAVLEPSAATERTSLRYVSGFQPPAVVFNEVLPQSVTVLEDLYPQAVRNDPAFEPPDFAELYNPGTTPLAVGGMFLASTRSRSCAADGSACPPDIIRSVREFAIPAGTSIPPKEFLLFLFTSESRRNTAPQLGGTGLEGKTIRVRDSIDLDDCHDGLILISSDAGGNCPVDRFDWDFRPGGGDCAPGDLMPDTPFGSLPDGADNVVTLDPPTPGESNCIYGAPDVASAETTVVGTTGPGGCLLPDNAVRIEALVSIAWRELILNPDELGVQSAEVIVEKDGVAEAPVSIGALGGSIVRSEADDPGPCSIAVRVAVDVPAPGEGETASRVSYALRVTDTRGGAVTSEPSVFDVCTGEGEFIRGDANRDGHINVTDLVWINFVIFGIFPPTSCMDALDANDDGAVDQADFLHLADFIFRRGPRVPDPYPLPGIDPTPDDLECDPPPDGSEEP